MGDRELARELHDGLAQELAFIAVEAHRLAPGGPLERAAQRALDEVRALMQGLAAPADEPLSQTLASAAADVAARAGARVELDQPVAWAAVAPVAGVLIAVTPQTRHHLIRIVREAVGNAVRHGQAETVRLTVAEAASGVRVQVADDGAGFDVGAALTAAPGFGLVSMRERAAALGGRLDIRSAASGGTVVEVVIP